MFLTREQILQTAKRSAEINRQRMRDCYAEVSTEFADALFDACMSEWRTGPSVTWMRLNGAAKDHILHAWQYRDDIGMPKLALLADKERFCFVKNLS